MANIGTFKKVGEDYTGIIKTLLLKTPAVLIAVPKTNDKAPDFRLTADGGEIGAGWKRTSREGGKEFISVTIDDPSLSHQINAALFKAPDQEEYFLTWQRQ